MAGHMRDVTVAVGREMLWVRDSAARAAPPLPPSTPPSTRYPHAWLGQRQCGKGGSSLTTQHTTHRARPHLLISRPEESTMADL